MVLQEKLQEFLLMSPLHLVVVLHGVRLVGRSLRRSALCEQGLRKRAKQQRSQQVPQGAL